MKRHEDKSTRTVDGEGISRRRPLAHWRRTNLFWAIPPRRQP